MASMDRSQLLRGVLDAAVLAVIGQRDGYGYDVVRRLREAGLTEVADASVYGALRRLHKGGALNSFVMPSHEGPHRRYYGMTAQGQQQLADARETWTGFAAVLSAMLEQDPGRAGGAPSTEPAALPGEGEPATPRSSSSP
jgi:PadR family transcriptional regulator PadR